MTDTPATAAQASTDLVPRTDPLAPGLKTTEGIAAFATLALTILAAVVPPLWDALSSLSKTFPEVHYIASALSVVGLLGSVIVALGYGKQRASIKAAAVMGGSQAGFVGLRLLVGLAVLAVLGLVACAAMKGDTVTASAGPHGGCVSSDQYVRLGNSQIECLSACISDQTGVQVTCRPLAKPANAQAMVIPTTTTTP
jgi:hypothetical protein